MGSPPGRLPHPSVRAHACPKGPQRLSHLQTQLQLLSLELWPNSTAPSPCPAPTRVSPLSSPSLHAILQLSYSFQLLPLPPWLFLAFPLINTLSTLQNPTQNSSPLTSLPGKICKQLALPLCSPSLGLTEPYSPGTNSSGSVLGAVVWGWIKVTPVQEVPCSAGGGAPLDLWLSEKAEWDSKMAAIGLCGCWCEMGAQLGGHRMARVAQLLRASPWQGPIGQL